MRAVAGATRRSAWINSAAVDLVIGCGAWSLPLLLLAYPFTTGDLPIWTASFYTLALVFNYPHYMATIYRAYHTKEDFARYRIYTLHFTVLIALTLVAAHWSYRLVPWLFTIYITWSPWHYMGQNFGLAMMFIRRNGVSIDRKDRNALWTSFVASYLMIFLSFHTNPSSDPYVLSLGLPNLMDVLRVPLLFIFGILGIWPLSKLVRQAGWRPMIAPITLYVTEFLWFVLPTVLELTMGIRPPQTRYAAGILAVMHAAQYLWITSYYARQEAGAGVSWRWKTYFLVLVVGGMALFIPGPWLASIALGRDFSSSFLAFSALINIHHFILDGAVWKLRETRVASLLIATDRKAEPAAVTVWRMSPGSPWRYVGMGAVGLLLLLAGLDQVRYYLGIRPRDTSSLALAATLNPYDAVIQTRLGRAYAATGDVERTERSLRQSIQLNPYNFEGQNALARLLIESGRYAPAYTHYQQMFSRIEPDATSLLNYGILCRELNRHDEAIQSFVRVLEKNPGYAPAHLHLAQIYDSDGKTALALSHYEQYVAQMSSVPPEMIVDQQQILPARRRLEELKSGR